MCGAFNPVIGATVDQPNLPTQHTINSRVMAELDWIFTHVTLENDCVVIVP